MLIGKRDMHLKNWSLIYPDQLQTRHMKSTCPMYRHVCHICRTNKK
ncbi:MAG: hypothetical protein RJQ07_02880 [Pseudomonadales bacterium]